MLILLTNDDGIRAPGLAAMHRELLNLGDVVVVAPETVQSATGHGITLDAPLLTRGVEFAPGFEGVAVDGRPADCVKLAISQLLPTAPDLVVSGINAGANVGINVVYSGTVAAAIEAAFLGLPAVAVSLHLTREVPTDYPRVAAWALDAIARCRAAGLGPRQVANVNLPSLPAGSPPPPTRFVRQCTRPWVDHYERREDPRGRPYYWNDSVFALGDTDDDTDVAALRSGHIAVTPLHFDLTDPLLLRRWRRDPSER